MLQLYVGAVTSNYEDNYANRPIADCRIWLESIPGRFILEKRVAAPVFFATHHHVRSLFE